jgi:hypothetical protein
MSEGVSARLRCVRSPLQFINKAESRSSQPSTKVTFSKTILFSRMNLAVFLP